MEISLTIEPLEEVNIETEEVVEKYENDYEKLANKPLLNGREINGNMEESDPTVPDWAKTPSKPTYTPEEVGALKESAAISLEEIDSMFQEIFSI